MYRISLKTKNRVNNFVLFESKIVELTNGSDFLVDNNTDWSEFEMQLLDDVFLAGYIERSNLINLVMQDCIEIAKSWTDTRWLDYLKEDCITVIEGYYQTLISRGISNE